MESPVRKMQKRNDYNRHKLLRKIKRRRKAEAEQQSHAAEKELRRKMKMPKFDMGTDPEQDDKKGYNTSWDKLIEKPYFFGLLSEPDGQESFNRAYNFVLAYTNSPGFKRRFREHAKNASNFAYKGNIYPDIMDYKAFIDLKKPKIELYNGDNALYSKRDNTIKYDPDYDGRAIGSPNLEYVFDHELGHWLDKAIKYKERLKNGDGEWVYAGKSWSDSYPIFKRNSEFQNILRKLSPETRERLEEDPTIYYGTLHDELPIESYADLMELRGQLYRSGIYNSLKDYEFEKKHLDRFKKINPQFRMFKYFSDEDIIEMMNTVAQNNTSDDIFKVDDGIYRADKGKDAKFDSRSNVLPELVVTGRKRLKMPSLQDVLFEQLDPYKQLDDYVKRSMNPYGDIPQFDDGLDSNKDFSANTNALTASRDFFIDNDGRFYYQNGEGLIVPSYETVMHYNPNYQEGDPLTGLNGYHVDTKDLQEIKKGTNYYQASDGRISLTPFKEVPVTQGMSTSMQDKPLETVSPEFDIITGASLAKDAYNLARKKLGNVIKRSTLKPIHNMQTIAELDIAKDPYILFAEKDANYIQKMLNGRSSSDIVDWIETHPEESKSILMRKASVYPVYGNDRGLQNTLDDVLEFYKNDVYPRIHKADSEAGVSSQVKPSLITSTPGLDNVLIFLYNVKPKNVAGSAKNNVQYLYGERNDIPQTIAHELRHNLGNWIREHYGRYGRDITGYTRRERHALDDAYNFTENYIQDNPNMFPIKEKAATNTELRYELSKVFSDKFGRKIYGKELDDLIYKMNTDELLNRLQKINGYGNNFVENLKLLPGYSDYQWDIKAKAADNIKHALKYVGGYSLPMVVSEKYINNVNNK